MKRLTQATAISALSFFLAACSGDPDANDIKKTGLTPLGAPDRTLTCYDYNGNKVLQEKPTKVVTVDSSYGYVKSYYEEERKPTYINGGAGCVTDTIYFNPADTRNIKLYEHASQGAPYTAVVTNGMDKIILAGKFTSVANDYGTTVLKLEINGVPIRNVQVQGMHVIATENREGIDESILQSASPN